VEQRELEPVHYFFAMELERPYVSLKDLVVGALKVLKECRGSAGEGSREILVIEFQKLNECVGLLAALTISIRSFHTPNSTIYFMISPAYV